MSSLDALRARQPDLGFAVYAYEPGGPVTLEVLTPDSATYVWTAPTLDMAIASAFPEPEVTEPTPDIFG